MPLTFNAIFLQFLKYSGWALLCFLLAGYLFFPASLIPVLLAYLLSFAFVASNFWIVRKLKREGEARFYRQFLITLSLRFVLVTAALIFMLKVIIFQQIYFTVSFIISYIFHSVIEIFSINKILETDTKI